MLDRCTGQVKDSLGANIGKVPLWGSIKSIYFTTNPGQPGNLDADLPMGLGGIGFEELDLRNLILGIVMSLGKLATIAYTDRWSGRIGRLVLEPGVLGTGVPVGPWERLVTVLLSSGLWSFGS